MNEFPKPLIYATLNSNAYILIDKKGRMQVQRRSLLDFVMLILSKDNRCDLSKSNVVL